MNNRRVALIAFLFLLFIGLCGGSLGVIILPIAEDLGVGPGDVASQFSIFSLGSTLFIIATTGVVVKFLTIRKSIFLSGFSLGLGSLAILMTNTVFLLALSFLLFGFGVGMAYSLGQFIILSIYEGKERNSKISLLNFFYSLGAVISPIVGAYVMTKFGVSWKFIFTGTTAVVYINALLALSADFSKIEVKRLEKREEEGEVEKEKSLGEQFKEIPAVAFLIILSVFLYSMSEVSLTTWLVPYSQEIAGVDPVVAGALFSTFWLFVGIGRFSSSFILQRVKAEVYLIVAALYTSIIVTLFVSLRDNVAGYTTLLMGLLGIGYSALLSTISSYGTLQVPRKNRMLVTILLAAGSLGPIAAPLVSSQIQKSIGYTGVVYSSAAFMVTVAALLSISVLINKVRHYNPYEHAKELDND